MFSDVHSSLLFYETSINQLSLYLTMAVKYESLIMWYIQVTAMRWHGWKGRVLKWKYIILVQQDDGAPGDTKKKNNNK